VRYRTSLTFSLLLAGCIHADVVTVVNPSFEMPQLCPDLSVPGFTACVTDRQSWNSTVFPVGSGGPIPYGWFTNNISGPVGEYVPSLAHYNGGSLTPGNPFVVASVADGPSQVAFTGGGSPGSEIIQQVGIVAPSTYYSLGVAVGSPLTLFNSDPNSPTANSPGTFAIRLVPGSGNDIANAIGPIQPTGTFNNVTTRFRGVQSGSVGTPLFIILGSSNGEVDYDAVSLTSTSVTYGLNEWVSRPVSSTGYKVVLAGDVRSAFDPSALISLGSDGFANPWADRGGTATVTATLDTDGNTDLTFQGSFPIFNTDQFCYGPPNSPCNSLPHFGLEGSEVSCVGNNCTPFIVVNQFWIDGPAPPLPGLTLDGSDLTGQTVGWAVVYADSNAGGELAGQWFEVPYTTDYFPLLTLTNHMGFAETLSNIGFFLSPTQIPLGDLNFGLFSPPGVPGSRFTSVGILDGMTLQSGQSVEFVAAPEPATFLYALVTVTWLLWYRIARGRRPRCHSGTGHTLLLSGVGRRDPQRCAHRADHVAFRQQLGRNAAPSCFGHLQGHDQERHGKREDGVTQALDAYRLAVVQLSAVCGV
jgi:hypothetical protein